MKTGNLPYPELTQQGGPSLKGISSNLDWCLKLWGNT